MRAWIMRLRRVWSVIIMLFTALVGASDQFLPAFQGLIPPMAYAGLAVALALLPSILDRRGPDRK